MKHAEAKQIVKLAESAVEYFFGSGEYGTESQFITDVRKVPYTIQEYSVKVGDCITDVSNELALFLEEQAIAGANLTEELSLEICDFFVSRAYDIEYMAVELSDFLSKKVDEGAQFVIDIGNDIVDFVNRRSEDIMNFCDWMIDEANEFVEKIDLEIIEEIFNKSLERTFKNLLGDLIDLFHEAEETRSPLLLDLNGDGVQTTLLADGVHFDHDNNGFAEKSAWVSKEDGILVRDIDGNGLIDNGSELFGNNTILKDGTKSNNGFDALADFDDNKDGKIDAEDAIYNQLEVWKDVNGNAITESGELVKLSDIGISAISTNYNETTTIDKQGNEHRQSGTYEKTDGSSSIVEDIWFKTDAMNTNPMELLEETEEISNLPDIKGFGNVYSLHQAMLRDESGHLQNLIEQFANESDETVRKQLVTNIIYAWTGVEDVDPESRAATQIYGNVIGDARKLETLEECLGEE